ncbi:acyl carrier protein [Streptomyces sp. URMC 129]|uniref:acyl carrier protein n=1 Tax=Streptomyces sp. URMC 129 TaxID=3423407 RepID=UPI003F1A9CD2
MRRTGRVEELTGALGMAGLTAATALTALDELLTVPGPAAVTVGDADWGSTHRFLRGLAAPRTAHLLPAGREADRGGDEPLVRDLAGVPPEEAARLVEDALTEALARVMRTTPDRVDRRRRLDELGVDSLMTAELAVQISRRTRREVPAMELAGAESVQALARRVLARLVRPANAG